MPWAAVVLCVLSVPATSAGSGGTLVAQANGSGGNLQGHKPGEPTGPEEPATHLTLPLSPLHLSDDQRAKIRAAVADKDTEVTFQLKTTKPLKSFNPTVGVKIPPHLPAHALPTSVTTRLPQLADYQYTKVKGQILIVNPMTKKVVDVFPEKSG
jgi:hypothetical protein